MKTVLIGAALMLIGIAVWLGVAAWIRVTGTWNEPATPTWVLTYAGFSLGPFIIGGVLVIVGMIWSDR